MAEFKVVRDDEELTAESRTARAAAGILGIALSALSQRALAAVADLFTLLTVASAWWLWWLIPAPTTLQIISLSIYALFVLAANFIVRRMR